MNGITGPLDLHDAHDIADMLVTLRKAVHPATWVPELIAERESAQLKNLW